MATDAGQAPGHPHGLPGADVGVQITISGPQFGRRGRPIEAGRIGIDSLVGENLALLAALGPQHVQCPSLRFLVSRVLHGFYPLPRVVIDRSQSHRTTMVILGRRKS